MTEEIEIREPEVIVFTDDDKIRAEDLSYRVGASVREICDGQKAIAQGYAELGGALWLIQKNCYWSLWNFASFGEYVDSIRYQVEKGRTQIYNAVSVAKRLLPHVSQEQLEIMGITKGNVLASHVRRTGRAPAPELLAKALHSEITIQELKAAVFELENVKPEEQKGTYLDLGGFYASPDEKREIEYAFSVAERTDPVIPQDRADWLRKKEIILRLAREYVSSYGALVERGEG